MRRYSANYIYTVCGEPIRNGVVGVDEDGKIVEIIDPKGEEKELAGTEFYNGIIVPGFVNAHCHTELAHLRGRIKPETGLAGFVNQIRALRNNEETIEANPIANALEELRREGMVAVADICNTSNSLMDKLSSPIRFQNLIELFGMSPEKADDYMERARYILTFPRFKQGDSSAITPHSVYSLSEQLWSKVKYEIKNNPVVSIHFAESRQERELSLYKTGKLADYYKSWDLPIDAIPQGTHVEIAKRYLPQSPIILFIHNTFLTIDEAKQLKTHFPNGYFVLCPASNLFIEKTLPNVPMMIDLGLNIALGTDSLASSPTLSMLEQIKILHEHFPNIPFSQILKWSTLIGAKALGFDKELGSLELGKKPGLNLIAPFDFSSMKPMPNSRNKRLV
jgi:cytosine/adenosine deaminase-related metal-dependent hydrolase